MRWSAPLLLLLLACATKPPATEPAPPIEAGPSNVLTVADIRIASGVDTTHAATLDAVNCLRRYFTRKMDPEAPNDYWYAPDIDHYGGPYAELRYAEYDSVGDLRYRPTVLEVRAAGEGELLLKVMWSEQPGTLDSSHAKYAFEFLVRSTAEGARLSLPIAHNTASWERRTVGAVTYIISPRHAFNTAEAEEQRIMIERLSAFFEVPPFPITYYSYTGPADLYAARGFLRHPLMHTLASGGMVDGTNNVHSGNNKDIYTHEVVHLFSQSRTKEPPPLLEEGLATLIGGSVEHDYAWHRANLAFYLAADPSLDLRDRCTTTMRDYINADTSVPYMIGAVLCERILRRDGCLRSMEVHEGRVFIGTYGGGAYLYDHGRLQRLPMDRQGFLTHVHTFMPDGRGRMWISSNRGLFSVALGDIDAYMADTTTHVYYAYYGRNEGILNPEFNGGCDPAYVRLADGRAVFPTLDGLVEFDPDQVPDPVPQGRVLVESVNIDGVAVEPRSEIVMEPGQQEVSVRFSLAYWGAQANVQLEYTLSSIQDRWQPIGSGERELRFSRLPPGIYALTIRKLGARADEEPTRLRFQVLAPFHRQRWFLVMVAMLVVLLFFGAVRLNEMRLRNKNIELENAVQERTRDMELANERLRSSMEVKERLVSIISHDIVTPLRFIARVARSTNRTPEVNAELSDNLRDIALSSDKLYANARNMLSWIKHQEGHIELRPLHVALNPLVEEALDMVRELAASQGDALINDVPLDDVLRTDRDLLLIILQNIISNAVNYTRNGEVRVTGGQQDHHYELCISDSGPGITPKAQAHVNDILSGQRGRRGMDHGDPEMQGLGYVIVGELATLLGGSVEVGNGSKGGAMVTIKLPLQAADPQLL